MVEHQENEESVTDVEIKLRPGQERLESLKFGYVRKGQNGEIEHARLEHRPPARSAGEVY